MDNTYRRLRKDMREYPWPNEEIKLFVQESTLNYMEVKVVYDLVYLTHKLWENFSFIPYDLIDEHISLVSFENFTIAKLPEKFIKGYKDRLDIMPPLHFRLYIYEQKMSKQIHA